MCISKLHLLKTEGKLTHIHTLSLYTNSYTQTHWRSTHKQTNRRSLVQLCEGTWDWLLSTVHSQVSGWEEGFKGLDGVDFALSLQSLLSPRGTSLITQGLYHCTTKVRADLPFTNTSSPLYQLTANRPCTDNFASVYMSVAMVCMVTQTACAALVLATIVLFYL